MAGPVSGFLDGWVVGLSEGYTRRANSVNPLYPGLLEPDRKVEMCEATYAERRLPTVFKMTPLAMEDGLDDLLALRDYEKSRQRGSKRLPWTALWVTSMTPRFWNNQTVGGWQITVVSSGSRPPNFGKQKPFWTGSAWRSDSYRSASMDDVWQRASPRSRGPSSGFLGSRPTLTIDVEGWGEG